MVRNAILTAASLPKSVQSATEAFVPTCTRYNIPAVPVQTTLVLGVPEMSEMVLVGCDRVAEWDGHSSHQGKIGELRSTWDRKGFCDQSTKSRQFCFNQHLHQQFICETRARHFTTLVFHLSSAGIGKHTVDSRRGSTLIISPNNQRKGTNKKPLNRHIRFEMTVLLSWAPRHQHTSGK